MRIEASSLHLESTYSFRQYHDKTERLFLQTSGISRRERLNLHAPESSKLPGEESTKEDAKLLIIRKLVEAITGEVIEKLDLFDRVGDEPKTSEKEGSRPPGWSLRYELREVYREEESVGFSAQGVVKTSDGREIQFSLSFSLSRAFLEERIFSMAMGNGDPSDPLVLNLEGNRPGISNVKILFDLDGDGILEEMPFVRSGSAFLVFDRNKNGLVDNGYELLGPATGDGYGELACLDGDKNGWIDEGDDAFSQLYVWQILSEEQFSLVSLKDAGIGALGLYHVKTPFTQKNETLTPLWEMVKTGLYVQEDGRVGTLQQINLVI